MARQSDEAVDFQESRGLMSVRMGSADAPNLHVGFLPTIGALHQRAEILGEQRKKSGSYTRI